MTHWTQWLAWSVSVCLGAAVIFGRPWRRPVGRPSMLVQPPSDPRPQLPTPPGHHRRLLSPWAHLGTYRDAAPKSLQDEIDELRADAHSLRRDALDRLAELDRRIEAIEAKGARQ